MLLHLICSPCIHLKHANKINCLVCHVLARADAFGMLRHAALQCYCMTGSVLYAHAAAHSTKIEAEAVAKSPYRKVSAYSAIWKNISRYIALYSDAALYCAIFHALYTPDLPPPARISSSNLNVGWDMMYAPLLQI